VNGSDVAALAPLLALTCGALLTLLAVAVHRAHGVALGGALVTLVAAAVCLPVAAAHPGPVGFLLVSDALALYFQGLIVASGLATVLLAHRYLAGRAEQREEFYILVLLAALGAGVLAAARHFASFFLGLETLSVGLYGLIGYLRDERRAIEAGLKYLVLAAAASAFLLFGMALVYAVLGTLDLDRMADALAGAHGDGLLLAAGMGLVLVGIGFKLALVPFHMWTPDVYVGAPAPVTAFVATASKGAVFAVLLRFYHGLSVPGLPGLFTLLTLIALASMLAGNLLALLQHNVKRILAYSSIAHLGYALTALLAGGAAGYAAVGFYLAAYTVTILGAFGVVTVLSGSDREAEDLQDFRGLFWRRPWLAAVMTGCLLSLAGIPVTAGFVAKYQVLAAGVGASVWLLVLVLAVSSAIGLYYYLRIVVAMLSPVPDAALETDPPAVAGPGPAAGLALLVLALVLLWLGVFPAPLQSLAALAAAGLPGLLGQP